MDSIIIVLLAVNVLLLVAVLIVVIARTGRASNGATGQDPAALLRGDLRQVGDTVRQDLALQRTELGQALTREHHGQTAAQAQLRDLLDRSLTGVNEKLHQSSQTSLLAQNELKTTVETRFEELRVGNETKLEQLRLTVDEKLEGMRVGNEAKLEKMRETVDEKLQGTLEKRLGESFKLVSDRLEQVQKGLGEMQTLASDVGGLKRVLTNVKSRGSWGEVQLARQLEDVLTPDQYEQNVFIAPGSRDSVEFAVKLPGRNEGERAVYLPIDSKFPQEDYERLLEAQESGDKDAADAASKVVERVILTQAKLIAEKYIDPPHSTDFAIMYLPTEGLFAEVIRRPGLTSKLQNEIRVIVTGPTTLMSLLNSLQMGFRTLAIEQRSSEVWQVLSAAKQEFQKYGQVWDKLEKQLQTVQNTVQQGKTRTRAVERRLRAVESVELTGEQAALEDVFGDLDDLDAEPVGAEDSTVTGAATE